MLDVSVRENGGCYFKEGMCGDLGRRVPPMFFKDIFEIRNKDVYFLFVATFWGKRVFFPRWEARKNVVRLIGQVGGLMCTLYVRT